MQCTVAFKNYIRTFETKILRTVPNYTHKKDFFMNQNV